ncbi:hypothetical protein [Azospirillum sp. sgz301742]
MLVTLLLVVCSLSSPECKTVRPEVEDLTMVSCPLAGQVEGARWTEAHPGWRVDRTICIHGQPRKAA